MGRATREEWTVRVAQLKQSGLSLARFAAQIGVNAKTLSWWRTQLAAASTSPKRVRVRNRQERSAALAPLNFIEMTTSIDSGPVEVVLPSGISVRVRPGFDSSTLVRVLDVLDSRRR